MSVHAFGCVGPNDWSLKCPSRFKLYGPVVDFGYWHLDNPGKAPVFVGKGAADEALQKLYRKYGDDFVAARSIRDLMSYRARVSRAVREARGERCDLPTILEVEGYYHTNYEPSVAASEWMKSHPVPEGQK